MLTAKEVTAIGQMLGRVVLDVTTPLKKRIDELESRELSIDERVITDLIDERLVPVNQTLDVLPESLLKRLPAPRNGQDATDEQIRSAVAEYLRENPIRVPEDGKSVSVDDVRPLIEAMLAKYLLDFERNGQAVLRSLAEQIEAPKDGVDGKDADPAEVAERVIAKLDLKGQKQDIRQLCGELVKAAVAEIPIPKDGKDGSPGKDGADGKDGVDGLDGRDGAPGLAGKDGAPGKDGADGRDGQDGKSVTLADIEARIMAIHATWALDWEKRAQDIISRLPKPKDGRDAISLEGTTIELSEDERTLVIKLTAGDGKVYEHEVKLSHVIYREVWDKDTAYEKGDAVTYAGSLWICTVPNKGSRPGTSNASWRLSVKRGRDA